MTGGGGFIGMALVKELIRRGFEVTTFSRGDYPELAKTGAIIIKGDLCDREAVIKACTGVDIVFHVASKAGIWGSYRDYYRVNVSGTANVIDGCRENKVGWLVYTSSASVVFDGTDIQGGDESQPYPTRPLSHYTATKALAERMVLKADSPSLKTVALRPHLVLGPGDHHLVPRILAQASAGKLIRIGDGTNKTDISSIGNVVSAHICAAQAIQKNPEVSGKVFFITDGEPVVLWDHMNALLKENGLEPVKKSVPAWVALIATAFIEAVYHLFRITKEPRLTRFLVHELSRSHWFDISAARDMLDYQPEKR